MNVEQLYQRDRDGNYRCPRHGVTFEATGSCAGCDENPADFDPGNEVDEPLPDPPEGCWSSLDYERDLLAEAQTIKAKANFMSEMKVRSRICASTAAKLWDTYIKATRLLIMLAHDREHEAIQRQREKRDRKRRAGAAH